MSARTGDAGRSLPTRRPVAKEGLLLAACALGLVLPAADTSASLQARGSGSEGRQDAPASEVADDRRAEWEVILSEIAQEHYNDSFRLLDGSRFRESPEFTFLRGLQTFLGLGVARSHEDGTHLLRRAAMAGISPALTVFRALRPEEAEALPFPPAGDLSARVLIDPGRLRLPARWQASEAAEFPLNLAYALEWNRFQAIDDLTAQYNSGSAALWGIGTEIDIPSGLLWLRMAARGGQPNANHELFLLLDSGLLSESEYGPASGFLDRAIAFGHPPALLLRAKRILGDSPGEAEAAAAVDMLGNAARKDHIDSIKYLASLHSEGRIPNPDPREALRLYRRAAEFGDPVSLAEVAYSLDVGRGTARDREGAITLYRQAASLGNHWAMCRLAERLTASNPGDPDALAEAVAWLRRAAQAQHPRGLHLLGNCYLDGTGVERSEAEAFLLFEQAARRSFPAAQNTLGWMLLNGIGTPRDPEEAFTWFSLAHEKGNARARTNRALCLFFGWGTEADRSGAREELRALAGQDSTASELLRLLRHLEQDYASSAGKLVRATAASYESPDLPPDPGSDPGPAAGRTPQDDPARTTGSNREVPQAVVSQSPTIPEFLTFLGSTFRMDFRFLVQTDGTVSSPDLIRAAPFEIPELTRAIEVALLQWRFLPRLLDGHPVVTQVVLPITHGPGPWPSVGLR